MWQAKNHKAAPGYPVNARCVRSFALPQCGAALVTALFVVALATVAATAMISKAAVDIARTAVTLESEQAYLYALAVEDWAAGLLTKDGQKTDTDHLQESWAKALPTLAIDGGALSGYTEDAQGRFNLNNLAQEGETGARARARFTRLLEVLGLTTAIVAPIADWVDADQEVRFPDGAEDGDYTRLQPPYPAANRPMVSISELRLVKGVTDDIYEALAPYVTALPEATPININTASLPLMMALVSGLGQSSAEALMEARSREGFPNVEAFLSQLAYTGYRPDTAGLSVASQYFRVVAKVKRGRGRVQLTSLLKRSADAQVRTVKRTLVPEP
jgi:general secretion pathway protein K